jgi:hypothetical protein
LEEWNYRAIPKVKTWSYFLTIPKRFRFQEGDSLKLAYIRVFVQALQVQNAILKDSELDEIKKRIEALESTQSGKPGEAPVYTPVFDEAF